MILKKQEKPKPEKKAEEDALSKFFISTKERAGRAKDKTGPKAEAAGKEQAKPKVAHEVKESILSKFLSRHKERKKPAGDAPTAMEKGGEQTFAKTGPKAEPHERQEQVIYTAIDQIIEIVDSRGELPLQEVSRILNIPPERMEELAKILDEHGILQLHYPSNPLAKPVLRSLTKHDFKQLGRQSK